MAGQKQRTPGGGRAARGSGARGSAHNPARPRKATPEGTGKAPEVHGQEAPAAPGGATGHPPPGLGDARHAAAQRAAQQAQIMSENLFPAMMADALGYEGTFESRAYKVYLARLLEDAGNPADPIERMMLQQLGLAHFRLGQLHAAAGHSKTLEAVKIYNSVTARLWGEFRRTALALRLYKAHIPESRAESKLKIHKMAQ